MNKKITNSLTKTKIETRKNIKLKQSKIKDLNEQTTQ